MSHNAAGCVAYAVDMRNIYPFSYKKYIYLNIKLFKNLHQVYLCQIRSL